MFVQCRHTVGGLSNDNWTHAPEVLRPLSTQYSQEYHFLQPKTILIFRCPREISSERIFDKNSGTLLRAVEICFASSLYGFPMGYVTLWGLDRIFPNKEPAT